MRIQMNNKNLQQLDLLGDRKLAAIMAYIDYMIDNGAKQINIETRYEKLEIATDNVLPREKMESAEYQGLVRALVEAFGK